MKSHDPINDGQAEASTRALCSFALERCEDRFVGDDIAGNRVGGLDLDLLVAVVDMEHDLIVEGEVGRVRYQVDEGRFHQCGIADQGGVAHRLRERAEGLVWWPS